MEQEFIGLPLKPIFTPPTFWEQFCNDLLCRAGWDWLSYTTQAGLGFHAHSSSLRFVLCFTVCISMSMSSYTTRLGLGFHRELLSKTAFFTVKKLLCCISIPSTLFCAHLHFAAPPTLLGLLSCAKTASVCCCISTFYYDTWFFYYDSWMVSRIHLHLINIPHSTNPNIKDVSVRCAMPLQLIWILKSPQILHNSLKFTTANLVPEKTSNEIRWLCSVTFYLCSCAQWNIWLYSYDINKRSL